MKKILSALILTAFIAGGLMVFAPVQAQEGVLEGCWVTKPGAWLSDCATINAATAKTATNKCIFEDKASCGVCCFVQTLYNVTDWIFVILIALAGLFVVLGSMNLIMAGGDPGKVTSGRQYVMYAVIGLIVGFLARAIPAIVKLAVGA